MKIQLHSWSVTALNWFAVGSIQNNVLKDTKMFCKAETYILKIFIYMQTVAFKRSISHFKPLLSWEGNVSAPLPLSEEHILWSDRSMCKGPVKALIHITLETGQIEDW